MNKEFVPYEEALALKEFGFDEPCFKMSEHKKLCDEQSKPQGCQLHNLHCGYPECTIDKSIIPIPLPTYSQAFRWFREKHDLHRHICYFEDYQVWHGDLYELSTNSLMNFPMELSGYKTYEEAELDCLRKLIEIVKNK